MSLRELRQDASDLVRRVEAGEQIDITESGRLAAKLVPAQPKRWLTWADIADVFDGRADPGREEDRELVDRRSLGHPALKAVLDTSVLIATDLRPLQGELVISAAALAELHFGVLVTAEGAVHAERLRRLTMLQQWFTALPVDDAVGTSYGQRAAAVVAAGRRPHARVVDLLIAVTAHAHSARLYTRNAGDLVGIEDLVEIVAVQPALERDEQEPDLHSRDGRIAD